MAITPFAPGQPCQPQVLEAVGGAFDDVAASGIVLYAARGRTGLEVPAADVDGNGTCDTRDVIGFLNVWAGGC
jgi:hypothetical protein